MRLRRSGAAPSQQADPRPGEARPFPFLPKQLRGGRDLVGKKLRWAEVRSEPPAFVLSDDEGAVGAVIWDTKFSTHATARDATGTWTLEPAPRSSYRSLTGLGGFPLQLRGTTWGPGGSRVEFRNFHGLRLHRSGAPTLRWRSRNLFRLSTSWVDEDGRVRLRMRTRRRLRRFRGTVAMEYPARDDTVPLALLNIYLAYRIWLFPPGWMR